MRRERYVALLRGINVGGKNLIRMADLKACFEKGGFDEVATYIQSGNVVFTSDRSPGALAGQIEELLGASFDYRATVAVRSRRQMRTIVDSAPDGFGHEPHTYRYDVIYLLPPLRATEVVDQVPLRSGVDNVRAGDDVLYHWRLISRAAQSQLSRVVAMPMYQSMTIRNWNTTVRLRELVDP